jgi:glycosyltransferase involved in cell wall biosynthesis
MPDYVNAASAVLVTSDSEGFGLAILEALACRVPVLSTPVGVAPFVLAGVDGCFVGDFDPGQWAGLARSHLDAENPRAGDDWGARLFSAERMAERVIAAYEGLSMNSDDPDLSYTAPQ